MPGLQASAKRFGVEVMLAQLKLQGPAVFADADPQTYRRSALHDATREWPETNCFTDLWIEIINALGKNPVAALGFTVSQDFEGDQFTFFKFPPEDLAQLYGARLMELAVYDNMETHVATQIARGRMPLVEVDAFFLPDTKGLSYRLEHTKTAIGINFIDPVTKRMDYFHNAGLFSLCGEDYDTILATTLDEAALTTRLFPYTEFVKFDPPPLINEKETALHLLRKHLGRRPRHNPITAFQAAVKDQTAYVAQREPAFFHKYAFNTVRQVGANFELLHDHLLWLAQHGEEHLGEIAALSLAIATSAKSFQFQLARAAARKKFEGLAAHLDPMAEHYRNLMDHLTQRYA